MRVKGTWCEIISTGVWASLPF